MRLLKAILISGVILATCVPVTSEAQYAAPELFTKQATDTSVDDNTVAVNFNQLSSGVTSLTATVVRISGAAAGKVYFQGKTTTSGTWNNIDSLTMTDVAYQDKTIPITNMMYYDYRLSAVGSGSGRRVVRISYVRRPGTK